MDKNIVYTDDARKRIKLLPDNSVDCCVTSPPYWMQRDYGTMDQIGMEPTPELYVETMRSLFSEVRRVLKPQGTLWLNLGDTYAGAWKRSRNAPKDNSNYKQGTNKGSITNATYSTKGFKKKDLIGIPWMVAFALRSEGWYLRQDIIWNKPNHMPESVIDRCTKSHEYIFLLSKSNKYYFDQKSIKEPITDESVQRYMRAVGEKHKHTNGVPGHVKNNIANARANIKGYKHRSENGDGNLTGHSGYFDKDGNLIGDGMANKRSVWTVPIKGFKGAHFATFPEDLIVPCIKAGCPEGGIVLDLFGGAFTTAIVSQKLNRNWIIIESNPEYVKIGNKRRHEEFGMFV